MLVVVPVLARGCVVLLRVEAWLEVLVEAVDPKVVLGSAVVLSGETDVPVVDTGVSVVDTRVSLLEVLSVVVLVVVVVWVRSLVGGIVTVKLATIEPSGVGVVTAKETARRQHTNKATLVSRTCIVCSELRKKSECEDFRFEAVVNHP